MTNSTLPVTLAQHGIDFDKCTCNKNDEIAYFFCLIVWKLQSALLTLLDQTFVGGFLRTSIHPIYGITP